MKSQEMYTMYVSRVLGHLISNYSMYAPNWCARTTVQTENNTEVGKLLGGLHFHPSNCNILYF